jgi:hypothetical protein
MPGATGKLTPEDIQKVNAWLMRHHPGGNTVCPVCGSQNWWIGEHLVQPITVGADMSLQLGGIGYPQITVISNPCGYTMFLNAVIVGVLVPEQTEEQKKAG